MESPNGEVLKPPLIWQIASPHVALFWNDGAKKTGVSARWHRKGVSDDSDYFISAGATADVLKPIPHRRHIRVRMFFKYRAKLVIYGDFHARYHASVRRPRTARRVKPRLVRRRCTRRTRNEQKDRCDEMVAAALRIHDFAFNNVMPVNM
jgi:hypothetical protein